MRRRTKLAFVVAGWLPGSVYAATSCKILEDLKRYSVPVTDRVDVGQPRQYQAVPVHKIDVLLKGLSGQLGYREIKRP